VSMTFAMAFSPSCGARRMIAPTRRGGKTA
jgi:hypothetical protein